FTTVFGVWGFDPIMADSEDNFRALENAGNIAIMLSGAFPMVYLIRKYFSKGLHSVGSKVGLSEVGSAGFIATIANILAMLKLVKDMPP
ncbi:ethanolamine utilization protein EutH, partial [Staphylococcus equorum]